MMASQLKTTHFYDLGWYMVKKKWTEPAFVVQQVDLNKIGDVNSLSNDELKKRMMRAGYKFGQANSVTSHDDIYQLKVKG